MIGLVFGFLEEVVFFGLGGFIDIRYVGIIDVELVGVIGSFLVCVK